MLAARIRSIIVTLWVGSLWTIGYMVAPTLFATLTDRALAGTIAGSLFRIEAWLSVACALALLLLFKLKSADTPDDRNGRVRTKLVICMLACTLIGYFGLQPFMAELRQSVLPGEVMSGDARTRFALLHGISSAIYLVQSLLGVVLVVNTR
ncbi:MAG TPA: DUF4149 domain-containing protein [Noviherbaspirillum sp.]|jgi:hypothetical protein|uniref:DUF4149 domain-containing protein n=1 Tax=Noviherbaspirillum sp. TaxID=1926288 RepID=UPI002DDD772A|nr:DUF4149 domain-containing protein [Noviherbaspirillum sp.]HEV2610549.1 DUF4149 domain-containing protein [Noviherbaspirillum sp.]